MKSNRMGSLYFFFALSLLSLTIASEISGKVTFSTPSSAGARIVAKNIASGTLYNATTLDGVYSIQVPNGHYIVEGIPSDSVIVSSWIVPKFFSISNDLKIVDNAVLDFSFEPCFTVVALGFNDNGVALSFQDFSSFSWATDLNKVASRASVVEVFSQSYEMSTLGFSLPVGESRFLMSQFKISRVGNVVLTATNGGKGYSGIKEGGGMIINLNFEFAKEALATLTEKSNSESYSTLANDVIFSEIQGKMKNATKQTSDSPKAIISNEVIAESLAIESELEMKRANKDILKNRKSNLNIRITDEKGNAVPNVMIKLEQQSREFRFGMYGGQIPEGQEEYWRSMVAAGINSATVDFWWIDTEPTADNVNKNYILGQRIEFLKSLGLKLRATGMFQPDPEIIPQYALSMNYQEFSDSLFKHTFKMVSSYCKDFELIEVSTDLNSLANKMGYNSTQILQLQQVALNAIKQAAPNVKTSVSMPEDYFAQSKFTSFKGSRDSWDKTTLSPFDFSKLWIEAGQEIDQIGQQMYNGGNRAALGAPTPSYNPSFTLGTLSSHLDRLSTLGKPIRVSEIAVPGTWGGNWDDSEAGYLINRWNEDSQSDFIAKFYTMAFSKALNREITWWGLFDAAFAYPSGAFLDSNGNPKKSYQTLKKLIQSWTTKTDVTSDDKGIATVSAFGGTYKVSAFKNGALVGISELRFQEGKQLPLSVRITSKGATFSTNTLDIVDPVVAPPVPVPIKNTDAMIGSSNPQSGRSVPSWVVAVTVVGGVALFAVVSIIIVFLTLRRRPIAKLNEGSETPTSNAKKDVGLATKDTVKYDSDLEAGSEGEKKSNINITWMGQPLTNVPLDYSGSEGELSDSGRESENEAEEDEVSELEASSHDEQEEEADEEEEEIEEKEETLEGEESDEETL